MDSFTTASRLKLRFSSTKGPLSVEDLWDLKPEQLDLMGIELKNQLEASEGKSLRKIDKSSKENNHLKLKLDIIQYILDTMDAEHQKAQELKSLSSQYETIKGILEKKQLTAMESMTQEELIKLANSLKEKLG